MIRMFGFLSLILFCVSGCTTNTNTQMSQIQVRKVETKLGTDYKILGKTISPREAELAEDILYEFVCQKNFKYPRLCKDFRSYRRVYEKAKSSTTIIYNDDVLLILSSTYHGTSSFTVDGEKWKEEVESVKDGGDSIFHAAIKNKKVISLGTNGWA